jgi:hypothetical protein
MGGATEWRKRGTGLPGTEAEAGLHYGVRVGQCSGGNTKWERIVQTYSTIRASPYYMGSSQSMRGGFHYTGRGGLEFRGATAGVEQVGNIGRHQKGRKR